ncbi:hypothetical protein [Limosilactobacillus reuteri]|uniref:hypothetical protein n=1 Tax=Limosilactobacillus reuteri TaxID=1598 RepID=UPI00214B0E84|nr:hypothetical protein [Limosilactobacillus reuteri]MCR1862281.1 hypothetical protein [Limosilactobacillus reuteri]
MTKLINSRIVALLIGFWIACCLGVKAYDGAIVLLTVYLFALYENKKDVNSSQDPTQVATND